MSEAGYELLDSGGGRKLERVGPWTLDRQATGAPWRRALPAAEWSGADARLHRKESGGGSWEMRRALPGSWIIELGGLRLEVRATPFGHLGFFAEQVASWDWLRESIAAPATGGEPLRVLNLFAYTGGATLACAQAGAEVCHVDASKGIVDWARKDAALCGLAERPIRWIVEDCQAFVRREARRGRRYDGLVCDPPSFGRGPRGSVWKLERALPELLDGCRQILADRPRFVHLSGHTAGFSGIALENLVADILSPDAFEVDSGEMTIRETARGRSLPSGHYTRWRLRE
jgi:23S rRNA (cytosine1962-C5)-methyltransferase